MPAEPAPLQAPDETLAPLAGAGSLLLAVSGGPDSVALMLLVSRWSLRAQRDIAVATVDHGLRPESREEARLVGEWAGRLGFAHHSLLWDGPKPKTRIQERARGERYRLLARCAREIGASAIVTAHHADDQAETILFRLTRGSGVAGLAGMAKVAHLDELQLLRPLLDLRKQELEAICVAADHPFLRDPSNENPAYARTRLRSLRAVLQDNGLDTRALLRLGARAARSEAALVWSAAQIAASLPAERSETECRIAADALRALPQELLLRVVAVEIARIGDSAPRMERLEKAIDELTRALATGTPLRITLGGTLIALGKDAFTIKRESPRRADRAPVPKA